MGVKGWECGFSEWRLSLPQAGHPADTLSWGCSESAESHPQGSEFNVGGRILLAFLMCVGL